MKPAMRPHEAPFALRNASHGLANKGLLSVCIREVQKTLKESAKRLIESKLSDFRLGEARGVDSRVAVIR